METRELQVIIKGDASNFQKATENAGTSFGKMSLAVAAGNALWAASKAAVNLVEDAIGKVVNVVQESIDKTITFARQTATLQRNFGLTAEQGSGLIAVFQRFGLSVDDINKTFGIFQKHMLDIKDSESVGSSALEDLGIKVKGANGSLRSMGDVLLEVADKFKNDIPVTERAARAKELFGRAGMDLLPILVKGRDGIQELTDKAAKMGLVLSQDNVNAVMKLVSAQKDLDQAWSGLQTRLGLIFIPAIAKVVENINLWIDKQGGIDGVMAKFGPTLDEIANKIPPLIDKVMNFIQNIKPEDVNNFMHSLKTLAEYLQFVGGVITWIAGIIAAIWKPQLQAIDQASYHLTSTILDFINVNKQLANNIVRDWNNLRDGIANAIARIRGFIQSIPDTVRNAVGNLGGMLYGAGQNLIQGFINGIGSMLGRLWSIINQIATGPIRIVMRLLGIASPSKVFHGLGRNIGQGLADGIASTSRMIEDAVGMMTPSQRLADLTLSGSGIGSSQVTTNNRSVNNSVEVQVLGSNATPDEIQDGVLQGLRMAQRGL